MIKINDLFDMKKYYNADANTYEFKNEDGGFEDVEFCCDISVNSNIYASNIKAYNIIANDLIATDIHAGNIIANNINAHNIICLDVIIAEKKLAFYAACISYKNIKCKELISCRDNYILKSLDDKVFVNGKEYKDTEEISWKEHKKTLVETLAENAELKDAIEECHKELEHYKNVEQTLQNTLVMAQTTADDIKATAQSRAEQIIRDAQSEARRSSEEIAKEEFEIRKRTEELKRQFGVYKAKMEALLISQLELLQDSKDSEE